MKQFSNFLFWYSYRLGKYVDGTNQKEYYELEQGVPFHITKILFTPWIKTVTNVLKKLSFLNYHNVQKIFQDISKTLANKFFLKTSILIKILNPFHKCMLQIGKCLSKTYWWTMKRYKKLMFAFWKMLTKNTTSLLTALLLQYSEQKILILPNCWMERRGKVSGNFELRFLNLWNISFLYHVFRLLKPKKVSQNVISMMNPKLKPMITKSVVNAVGDENVLEDLLKEVEQYVSNLPQTFTLKMLASNDDRKMFDFMIFVSFVPRSTEGKFGHYQALLFYYNKTLPILFFLIQNFWIFIILLSEEKTS